MRMETAHDLTGRWRMKRASRWFARAAWPKQARAPSLGPSRALHAQTFHVSGTGSCRITLSNQVWLGMDTVSKEVRSRMMGSIKGKDTAPELAVRRAAHALGFRFRLHRRDLPGSPDIVFPSRNTALFVHGCYWHRHKGCRFAIPLNPTLHSGNKSSEKYRTR